MIEKKTMGYADFGYPQYEAKTVNVMADTETGVVELYKPDEDESSWEQPNAHEHFYPTLVEAQKALEAHRKELRELMPKVAELVSQMDNMRDMLDKMPDDADGYEWRKQHPEYFSRENFLPYNIAHVNDRSWQEKRADRLDRENTLLIQAVRCGTLTIKADTFRLKDVVQVKWGNERAEIHLTDDRTIETGSKWEFNVIAYIFGGNNSNFTYTRLNKKEGDE